VRGIRLASDAPFVELFAPVAARFDALFWYLDIQAGPFNVALASADVQGDLDERNIAVPWLEATSVSLWRPGVLPRHGELLVQDEWSYLVGIAGPEISALAAARRLLPLSPLSGAFFRAVRALEAIFLVRVTQGRWEAYGLDETSTKALGGEPVASAQWATGGHP
jgi:hypothetical protein